MKDRVPTKPKRIQLVPSADGDDLFLLDRADEPTQVGTPLNKTTLLKDATAAALGVTTEEKTVDDAFQAIRANFSKVTSGTADPSGTANPGDIYMQNSSANGRLVWIYEASGWVLLARAKLVQKTEIITETSYWTIPDDVKGDVLVRVFGGGAGGSTNSNTPTGGGGGEMATYTGALTPGTRYRVTIGKGGAAGSAGGTSSFGSLVSAAGGSGVNGGTGGGGAATTSQSAAGNGSSWWDSRSSRTISGGPS